MQWLQHAAFNLAGMPPFNASNNTDLDGGQQYGYDEDGPYPVERYDGGDVEELEPVASRSNLQESNQVLYSHVISCTTCANEISTANRILTRPINP